MLTGQSAEPRPAGDPARRRPAFAPNNLDLTLATAVAVGLPFAAAWLLAVTGGALASLLLYYLVCCVVLVRWRRGTLDYHWPQVWPWAIFLPALVLPVASAGLNWGTLHDHGAGWWPVLTTLIIWGGINGACEQLSWFYVLDAWRLRWRTGWQRWLGLAVGVLLTLTLVALIHIVFWVQFLPEREATSLAGLSIGINTLLTGAYYWLYRRSGSMWPVFVLHFLVDAQLVLLARYAIWPDVF